MLSRWLLRGGEGGSKGELCVGATHSIYLFIYIFFVRLSVAAFRFDHE